MVSDRIGRKRRQTSPKRLLPLIAGIFCTTSGFAGSWEITPRVTLSESYTDNVTQTHSNTESDFISEASPGISIRGDGSRLKLNLDYQLQSLYFAKDSARNDVHQGLAASGQGVVLPDWLFIDGTSSITQQVISAQQQISLDNFNAGVNRTDVRTYSLSPYLHHDFGGYVDSTLRYTHDSIEYGDQSAAENSRSNAVQASLISGRHSGPLTWNLNYNDQRIQRGSDSNPDNVRFKNTAGEVDYRLTSTLSAVVQGGREDNSFNTASAQPIVNGSYWGAGLAWAPSRFIAMRALDGDHFKTAGVTLTPNVRTSLAVTYRNRDVGLNPGPAWSGTLTHSTRNTVWQADYETDTTTSQELALGVVGRDIFFKEVDPGTGEITYRDLYGNVIGVPPGTNPADLPPDLSYNILGLTNEVIARKRATGTITYHRRKTTLGLSLFDERREYQVTLRRERAQGVTASWGLELSPRTRSMLTLGDQRNQFSAGSLTNEIRYLRAGLTRDLGRNVSGDLEYLLFDETSDSITSEYRENRLTARLTMRF